MVFIELLGKLLIVFILSGLFGLNRQRAHKPIGFGTFIFVSLGSSALAMTALRFSEQNPLPLLSAIVTGIGFLGAGAMIKNNDKIFGATTAASIWVFAIFGLLIGVGEYATAFIIYTLLWLVIFIDFLLQERGIGSYQRRVVITTELSVPDKQLLLLLSQTSQHFKVLDLVVDKKEGIKTCTYLVEGTRDAITRLPKHLLNQKGFIKCVIQ